MGSGFRRLLLDGNSADQVPQLHDDFRRRIIIVGGVTRKVGLPDFDRGLGHVGDTFPPSDIRACRSRLVTVVRGYKNIVQQ